MALRSYFDFAEDDYQYLMKAYQSEWIANFMGTVSQNICERYMKHIIDKYDHPESDPDDDHSERRKSSVLRTHSLHTLMQYLSSNMHFNVGNETRDEMSYIDGFYFTTRYPGDESIQLDQYDVEHCVKAATLCRCEMISLEENILEELLEQDISDEDKTEYSNRIKEIKGIKQIKGCLKD